MATMPSLTTHNEGFRTHLPAIHGLQVGKYSKVRPGRSKRTHSIITANPITPDIHELDLPVKVLNRDVDPNTASSLSLSPANNTPPEILLQIYSLLTPRDFDNARHTCSQWMRVGMNRELLEKMLKRAGWWDAYQQDVEIQRGRSSLSIEESEAWRMSRRFATECLLAGRKANIEGSGFLTTQVIDFSALSQNLPPTKTRRALSHSRDKISHSTTSTFSSSICGNYVLVTTGCRIHVFQLLKRRSKVSEGSNSVDSDIVPIATIECIFEVISAVIDTTSRSRVIIAALLKSRTGMVCDLDMSKLSSENQQKRQMPKKSHISPHYYYSICSEDHPPRTIALYPGRRCVAFGCAGGIEIHWIDERTQQDQRKHFPMSQPSEVLHFLPSLSESPTEMRLISSLAGPGVHECACRQSPYPDHPKKCPFHLVADARSSGRRGPTNSSALSLVRATHCHHYRAVPINDGFHMIFVDPRTGFLCIGSDAPIGGPTRLTRAFVCVPPLEEMAGESNEAHMPTVFTVGSDLKWGLRVVAAYKDRIVLYSVPLDVFNVIRKERELQGDGVMGDSDLARDWFIDPERCRKRRESLVQNQNGDWEFLLSVRYRPTAMMWPFKIYGKEIGKVENVVELVLQSDDGGARVWAFGAHGKSTVLDIDTFTSPSQETRSAPKCKLAVVGSDGSIRSTQLSEMHEYKAPCLHSSRKRKRAQFHEDSHSDFFGRYGANRFVPGMALEDYTLPTTTQTENSSLRRPSFAACIVDFKIPELGTRKGRWRDDFDVS